MREEKGFFKNEKFPDWFKATHANGVSILNEINNYSQEKRNKEIRRWQILANSLLCLQLSTWKHNSIQNNYECIGNFKNQESDETTKLFNLKC